MAENKPIELRYYPQADPAALVLHRIWGLVQPGTTNPVEHDVAEAYLDFIVDGRVKRSLQLGSGLTYNPASKAILIQLTNSGASFIRETATLEYSFYVVWDYGAAQTIREGAVTAIRVA